MPTVSVGSLELFQETHGSGAPLLLIMGLAVDSTGWALQVPEFAKHYQTTVFDNRGVGRSSKPSGPYTIAEMATDTVGLMDELGIAQAHVVGISMGGMIAQELALQHPERVDRLVLACTYAEPLAAMARQQQESLAQFGGAIDSTGAMAVDAAALDPMALFQHLMPLVFTPTFLAQELPKLMQLMTGSLQWGFSVEGILAQVQACMGHHTTERLNQIAAPTLVLTGDADRLIAPEHSDVLAEKIPDAALLKLAGGSHGFNFETPAAFNNAVLQFLAGTA